MGWLIVLILIALVLPILQPVQRAVRGQEIATPLVAIALARFVGLVVVLLVHTNQLRSYATVLG